MPASVRGLADLVQREAGEAAGGFAVGLALAVLAGAFLATAFGFFVASATWKLTFEHGVVTATAIVGAAFLLLAGVTILVARWRARRRAAIAGRLRRRRQEAMRQLAAETSLNALLGVAGLTAGKRGYVVPIASGVALGWLAERRLRRRR